eukprot:m.190830 g.190830  ORF g.190830 m.190830 type:complete len:1825 (+) comp21711_c1_seq2:66-5540(+)
MALSVELGNMPPARHASQERGSPYNRFLPYADRLQQEAVEYWEDIKRGFAEVVAKRDYGLALKFWCTRLEGHLLLYKYSFSLEDHVRIVRLLFEVFQEPELDVPSTQRMASVVRHLIKKRDLFPSSADPSKHSICLPWRPFHDIIKRHFFCKLRGTVPQPKEFGVVVARFARAARRFFAPESTSEILAEYRPVLCPHDQAVHFAAGMLCLLLPTARDSPAGTAPAFLTWMEEMISVWGWFHNSADWDQLWLSLFARAARDNVGQINWTPHLPMLFNKFLNCTSVPVGSEKPVNQNTSRLPHNVLLLMPEGDQLVGQISVLIIHMIEPGNTVLDYLQRLLRSVESFFHPSNTGSWSPHLGSFLNLLCSQFARRLHEESLPNSIIPAKFRLGADVRRRFAEILKPVVFLAQFSKSPHMVANSTYALRELAFISPETVLPPFLERVFPALETLTETHQTVSILSALVTVCRPLLSPRNFPPGSTHLSTLLMLSLPGIDANDSIKTSITLQFYMAVLNMTCIADVAGADVPPDAPAAKRSMLANTALYEDWVSQLLDRVFALVQNCGERATAAERSLGLLACDMVQSLLRQLSPPLFTQALRRLHTWITTHIVLGAGKVAGHMCALTVRAHPTQALQTLLPPVCARIAVLAEGAPRVQHSQDAHSDDELVWLMHLVARMVKFGGAALLLHRDCLMQVLDATLYLSAKAPRKLAGKLLRHTLKSLLSLYVVDWHTLPQSLRDDAAHRIYDLTCWDEGVFGEQEVQWHVPTVEERQFAEDLVTRFYLPAFNHVEAMVAGSEPYNKEIVKAHLSVLRNVVRVGLDLFPETQHEPVYKYDRPTDAFMKPMRLQSDMPHEISEVNSKRRDQLCDLAHKLCQYLLDQREDDIKELSLTIKIVFQLLCVRGMRDSKFKRAMSVYRFQKSLISDPIHGYKKHCRTIVLQRVMLQHMRRMTIHRLASVYDQQHAALVADLFRLSVSVYARVRAKAQLALFSALAVFQKAKNDVTHMAMDVLLDAKVGAEVDVTMDEGRVKGALHVLMNRSLTRRTAVRCDLLAKLVPAIVSQHDREKESIQKLITNVLQAILREYRKVNLELHMPEKLHALAAPLCPAVYEDAPLEMFSAEAKQRYAQRVKEYDHLLEVLQTAFADVSHWRFRLLLCKFLQQYIRDDRPVSVPVVLFFARGMADDAVQVRNLCVSTFNRVLALQKTVVPKVPAVARADGVYPASDCTEGSLQSEALPLGHRPDNAFLCFKSDPALRPITALAYNSAVFVDRNWSGWSGWSPQLRVHVPLADLPENTPLHERDAAVLRVMAEPGFLTLFMELNSQEKNEGHERFQDGRAEVFKGLFRNLKTPFLELVKIEVEKLCAATDKAAKQRLAAEVIGGMVRGVKHWRYEELQPLWEWLIPLLRTTLAAVTNECVEVWCDGLRMACYDKDPRRIYPLLDLLFEAPLQSSDSDTSFAQYRRLYFLSAALEELSWRGAEPSIQLLQDLKPFLGHAYKLVRERIGHCIGVVFRNVWLPQHPRSPATRSPASLQCDDLIMYMLREISKSKDSESEEQAQPAVCMVKTLMLWMFPMVRLDGPNILARYLDCVLPTVLNAPEMSKDQELQTMCKQALLVASQTILPAELCGRVFAVVKSAHQSPSWHVRMRSIAMLQIVTFRNYFTAPSADIVAVLASLLYDDRPEVRTIASVTLSGLVRCGLADDSRQRMAFEQLVQTPIRKPQPRLTGQMRAPSEKDKAAIAKRHAGLLGLQAYLSAFPYGVPEWMPRTLVLVSQRIGDPEPIRSTVKTTMSEFWRTHQDEWQSIKKLFTEDELLHITDLLISPSYYA